MSIPEIRENGLAILRSLEQKNLTAGELIIENDNPVWSLLLRFGALIRVPPDGSRVQYERAQRIASLPKGEERVELKLAHGRHLLEWDATRFEVFVSAFDGGREEARVFLGDTATANKFFDFLRHAREHSRRKGGSEVDKLVVKVMQKGFWRTVSSYPKRSPKSLVTGDDTVKNILRDMKRFVQSEDEYARFGFAFKRNYLIVGPPGSGKSSMVTLAASELDLDVCFISVTPGMDEKEICAAVSALTDNSMLVIEDADVLCSSAFGGGNGANTALAVLTNVLDGTLHRHKLMTVLTSAQPEALEAVLTRHGRIDYTCRLAPIGAKQVRAMVEHVFGDSRGMTEDGDGSVDRSVDRSVAVSILADRIWDQISRLGSVSSTTVAHFLFRHRHDDPSGIDEEVCEELTKGTHTEHILDTRSHSSEMFM